MTFEERCERKKTIKVLYREGISTCLTLAVPTTTPMRRFPLSLWCHPRATAREICFFAELKTRFPSTSSMAVLIRTARPSRCWTAIAQRLPGLELGGGWRPLFCSMGSVTQRSMSISMALDMVGKVTCMLFGREDERETRPGEGLKGAVDPRRGKRLCLYTSAMHVCTQP